VKEYGFILKRFLPFKQKVSILSQSTGKINIVTNPITKCQQLWPGMLVTFNIINQSTNMLMASHVEIVWNPEIKKSEDLFWLHELLQHCYYFSPLENPCPEIFYHLYNCFSIYKLKIRSKKLYFKIQRIAIFKLLTLLSFYPEKELVKFLGLYNQLEKSKETPKDFMNILQNINDTQIKKMDNWILKCINNHPYGGLLKIQFSRTKSL
jgi:hypothetical protein